MTDQTQDPQPDSPSADEPAGAGEDIKANMRRALERKHAAEHGGDAHLQGGTAAQGVHAKEGGRREFRRKAGG